MSATGTHWHVDYGCGCVRVTTDRPPPMCPTHARWRRKEPTRIDPNEHTTTDEEG